MYGARDISSTSSFIIASVTERSIFHALHIHTAAKTLFLLIVGQNKSVGKVRKKSILLPSSTVKRLNGKSVQSSGFAYC